MPKERRLAFINFVKPRSDANLTANLSKANTSEVAPHSTVSDGKQAKEFYCDVLSEPSSSVRRESHPVCKPRLKNNTGQRKPAQSVIQQPTVHRYFKAIEQGDVKEIAQYLDDGVDVDTVDEHGWTALMCASCSGQLEVVKLLVERKSNVSVINKKGQTALAIASRAKQLKVVKYLQGDKDKQPDEKEKVKNDSFYYCDVCQQEVHGCSEKSHNSSTIHLFNLKITPKEQNYTLPETNPGFQMMLRSGWDQEKGLGSSGQGRKNPVKTVLKRDRLGLGIKVKTAAKVTHFGPKENAAVEGPKPSAHRCMKLSTLSKRKQSKLQRKEKAKETAFRRDFH